MGTQLPPPPKMGTTAPLFGPCLLRTNGWMDHDATWYGNRPHPGHIVLDGDPAPHTERGTAAPYFSAHVYCGQMVIHLRNC